ncbi:MAG: SGNH/GDSL hydrolase family protein [Promethearchaeota archaeon]
MMKRLEVVAFGNSLTYGYPGFPSRPESRYTHWLSRLVDEWANSEGLDLEVRFRVHGVPGELTGDFLSRFERQVLGHRDGGSRKAEEAPLPDLVVFLGGSNDLGWGVAPEQVLANLKAMWDAVLSHGILLVACNIPPVGGESGAGRYTARKRELNEKIESYAQGRGFPVVDLYRGMADNSGDLRGEYDWGDGLHFSVVGYKRMGELVFKDGWLKVADKFR